MTQSHHAKILRSNVPADAQLERLEGVECIERALETFGIADARDLTNMAYGRPVEEDALVLVVRVNFITHEAQNALLKLLEEPPASTSFVFVVPYDFQFLPTLRSRFGAEEYSEDTAASEVFTEFLSQTPKERLAAIDKAAKAKDLAWQRQIKTGLIKMLGSSAGGASHIKELHYVATKLLTRGASNKMLLEHAALLLDSR
tara:strand:+ start:25740 stop:26342 length:603 start_codon:yes stop_codon:yes gene_type:complete